ncbi:hypothetical protein HDU92_003012 [Lobulomyces angularis]|nr:hypothetical protein HDU92_003012 [Lobulomyces angularis]
MDLYPYHVNLTDYEIIEDEELNSTETQSNLTIHYSSSFEKEKKKLFLISEKSSCLSDIKFDKSENFKYVGVCLDNSKSDLKCLNDAFCTIYEVKKDLLLFKLKDNSISSNKSTCIDGLSPEW